MSRSQRARTMSLALRKLHATVPPVARVHVRRLSGGGPPAVSRRVRCEWRWEHSALACAPATHRRGRGGYSLRGSGLSLHADKAPRSRTISDPTESKPLLSTHPNSISPRAAAAGPTRPATITRYVGECKGGVCALEQKWPHRHIYTRVCLDRSIDGSTDLPPTRPPKRP